MPAPVPYVHTAHRPPPTAYRRRTAMQVTKLTLGPYDNNVYIIAHERTGESVVVDASFDAAQIEAATAGTIVRAILLTHGDGDHIDALEDLKARLGVPVGI